MPAPPIAIAAVPSHADGDEFTQAMWANLQGNVDQGVVEQIGCEVTRTTNLSVPAATTTAVTFDTDLQDVYAMWAIGAAGNLVAKAQGWHRASLSTTWNAASQGKHVETHLLVNGVDVAIAGSMLNADGTHTSQVNAGFDVYLNAGDAVSFNLVSHLSGAQTVTAATARMVRT